MNYVETEVFRLLVDLETQKAARLKYPVALVCVSIDTPAEAADLLVTKQMAEAAVLHLRSTDVMTILTASAFGLLLVDVEPAQVRAIVRRVLEPAVDIATGHRNAPVGWSAGGSFYPGTATSARELMRQATELMSRARGDGPNRLYLPA